MDKKFVEQIKSQMEADEDRNEEFTAYDDIDNMKWKPPEGLRLDWMRVSIDSSGHDALKMGCNIFNTHKPNWTILPRSETDRANAKNQEQWLEWQMSRMNNRSSEPFRESLEHALKYGMVAGRLDYLPYWISGEPTGEQKIALEDGDFVLSLYHPGNIYFSDGKAALLWVACVENVLASAVADYWSFYASNTKEGKKIQSAVDELKKMAEDDDEARVILIDGTRTKDRLVLCVPTSNETLSSEDIDLGKDNIVVFDGENKLGFIPWAVVRGRDDPLLAPLHRGHLWENVNIWDTIANSTIAGRAFFPILNINSITDNGNLDIDFSGGGAILRTKTGETVQVLSPPPLDPGLREMLDRAYSKIQTATGLSNLANISNLKGNVQFATVNAIIQQSKTGLEPATRLAELFLSKIGKMCFQWLRANEKTSTGYVVERNQGKVTGVSQVSVKPEDFDPAELFVLCEFADNTPTDEQQRLNTFTTAKNAGAHITWSWIQDQMQWGNAESMESDFEEEAIRTAVLQAKQKEIVGAVEVKLQLEAAQIQQQQAQQQTQQSQNPGFDATQGQGFAPPEGGQSPYQANPAATQTQVSGQDNTGQGLA